MNYPGDDGLALIICATQSKTTVSDLFKSHSPEQSADTIPLFPLSALLFPGSRLELRIFETRYIRLIEQCMDTGGGFGVVRIEEGTEALHEPDARQPILASVGTLVHVVDHAALPDGQKRVTVLAGRRFELLGTSEHASRLLMGRVSWLQEESGETIPAELRHLRAMLSEFVESQAQGSIKIDLDSASEVSWWLARLVVRDVALGQRILSFNSPVERLRTIDEILSMQGAS